MRLAIRDFQSLVKADLKFDPGLTVITGANRAGKTAILRALSSILTNPPQATRYVRAGKTAFQVALKVADTVYQFSRNRSGVPVYKVGSGTYKKLGRKGLSEFAKENFIVQTNQDDIVNLQFRGMQFPFHISQQDQFRLFEAMFRLPDVNSVVSLIESEKRALMQKISVGTGEVETLGERLAYIQKSTVGLKTFNEDKIRSLLDGASEIVRDDEIVAGSGSIGKIDVMEAQYGVGDDVLNILRESGARQLVLSKSIPEVSSVGIDLGGREEFVFDGKILLTFLALSRYIEVEAVEFDAVEDRQFLDGGLELLLDLAKVYKQNQSIDVIETEISKCTEELDKFEFCPLCKRFFDGESEHMGQDGNINIDEAESRALLERFQSLTTQKDSLNQKVMRIRAERDAILANVNKVLQKYGVTSVEEFAKLYQQKQADLVKALNGLEKVLGETQQKVDEAERALSEYRKA